MTRFPVRTALAMALAALALPAAAALDVAGLDKSIAVCKDFYNHANKRWMEANRIPADRATWSAASVLARSTEDELREIIEAALKKPPRNGTPQRKMLDYYASGMDVDNIRHWQLKTIAVQLGTIRAIDGADPLARKIGELHARGIRPGFTFEVDQDRKDSKRYLAEIGQGGLGLPERDFYFRDDERTKAIRDEYRKHLVRVNVLYGDAQQLAERSAERVIALETELARASMTAVERRDVDKTYNLMSVADLQKLAPGFPWGAYLEGLLAPQVTELNVQQPAFFTRFAQLVAERPVEDWHAYLRWHLLQATSDKLDERYHALHFDFYERTLKGVKEPPPRWRHVLRVINGPYGTEPMSEALGMLYVERKFPPQAKARALELVQNVKDALADRLRSVDWMTEQTRALSLDKLAAMRIKIGYPDRWKDVSEANIARRLFVENWMSANQFAHLRDVARLGKPVQRDEWIMSPQIVNAYYNPTLNEIVFPAAILQPPFFDAKADDAVNYGAIGMAIGHEITHGFDDRGRRFDKDGNLRDWWTAEDARRYQERAKKVELQYNNFEGIEGIKVNGALTLGENLSDVGGLKIAYLALQKALKKRPQGRIEGLTPDQRFFLSFAQGWRSLYRTEQETLQLRTGQHSLPRFRVRGPIAHMPEFARAFSCDASATLLSEGERANIW